MSESDGELYVYLALCLLPAIAVAMESDGEAAMNGLAEGARSFSKAFGDHGTWRVLSLPIIQVL